MKRLGFFSGFPSDGTNLSVSIGATETSCTPPTTPPVNGAGTASATILATRSVLQTAPERVYFEAEVEGFTTLGPSTPDGYDPRMHDLVYEWDFGDPGARFMAPERGLPGWNDANRAFGPFVAHMFTAPGTYTVTLTVIEPETGENATTTMPFVVRDPETEFPGLNTIYVSAAGEFGTAPEGATLMNDLRAAIQGVRGSPKRIMLRGGETFAIPDRIWIRLQETSMHIMGEPGAAERPVIQYDAAIDPAFSLFSHRATLPTIETVYAGLRFQGEWDSVTETGRETVGISIEAKALGDVVVHDCEFNGLSQSVMEATAEKADQDQKSLFMSDTRVSDWRSIGQYAAGASRYAHIGCAIVAHEDAMAGGPKDGTHNEHGCIRYQPSHPYKAVIDGCDFFNRKGWFENHSTFRTQQSCIRWNQRSTPGSVLNMQRNSLEGGRRVFSGLAVATANGETPENVQNVLIDKNVFVGSHMTRNAIGIDHSGVTVRNNLMIFPDVERLNNIFDPSGAVGLSNVVNPDAVLDGPIRIYNNTAINLLSDNRRSGGLVAEFVRNKAGFSNVVVDNNIFHQPNTKTPQEPFGPLSDTPLWTPREKGYRSVEHPVLMTELATPDDTVRLSAPLAGSDALGAALTGLVSTFDIYGNSRPAYPSVGALEMP
jgi:PKD repeat protein